MGADREEGSTVMKRVIALGALLAGGGLLVAPGAGAATTATCPPGTTTGPYCKPALTLVIHTASSTRGGVVRVAVKCTAGSRCTGTLLLMNKGRIVGRASYSIAAGQSSSLRIHLSKSGRAALKRTGKLKTSVVTVVGGERTTIGRLTIKGKKAKPKHVTQVKGHPGFTG